MPPTVSPVEAPKASVPDAPSHLPEKVAAQWKAAFAKALAQARLDTPNNERAQRVAALKAANAMLAIPAPASAADIDKLEDWQVVKRGTRTVGGVEESFCVTSDGRKYCFPTASGKTKAADSGKPGAAQGEK